MKSRENWRDRMGRLVGRALSLLVVGFMLGGLTGCSLPQVKAEDRLFLNLSLDFLDVYQLPAIDFENTRVGGLSAITYDRQRDRFYAVSDDRSNFAPARFYTLKLVLDRQDPEQVGIDRVEVEKVTLLTDEAGATYAAGTTDTEGIALSPRQSVFISSEGAEGGVAPFINEYDLETGQLRTQLRIPARYLPQTIDDKPQGVQDNAGFEALTLIAGSAANPLEPFRLFVGTESALQQDMQPEQQASIVERLLSTGSSLQSRNRVMHYLIGENEAALLAEHLYLVDPDPAGAINNGLSELLTLDQGGHFLSLERSFGVEGFSAKLFQLASGGALDISGVTTLSGSIDGVPPIRKQLLLDLQELGIPLDNLEGLTLGPQLPDRSQSLLLISDDNFNEEQVTQLLLFRLRQG